jgi:hypothetical protein
VLETEEAEVGIRTEGGVRALIEMMEIFGQWKLASSSVLFKEQRCIDCVQPIK